MQLKTFIIIVVSLALACILLEFSGMADDIVNKAAAAEVSVTASVPCTEINCPPDVVEVESGWFESITDWFLDVWGF